MSDHIYWLIPTSSMLPKTITIAQFIICFYLCMTCIYPRTSHTLPQYIYRRGQLYILATYTNGIWHTINHGRCRLDGPLYIVQWARLIGHWWGIDGFYTHNRHPPPPPQHAHPYRYTPTHTPTHTSPEARNTMHYTAIKGRASAVHPIARSIKTA